MSKKTKTPVAYKIQEEILTAFTNRKNPDQASKEKELQDIDKFCKKDTDCQSRKCKIKIFNEQTSLPKNFEKENNLDTKIVLYETIREYYKSNTKNNDADAIKKLTLLLKIKYEKYKDPFSKKQLIENDLKELITNTLNTLDFTAGDIDSQLKNLIKTEKETVEKRNTEHYYNTFLEKNKNNLDIVNEGGKQVIKYGKCLV